MKTKILFILITITSLCNAQTVTIPDVNFKNALTSSLCVDADLNGSYESDADLNNDGQIQSSEATVIQRLNISNKNITNLTGLQSFINLRVLLCNDNQISVLSLSTGFGGALTFLQNLDCSHNSLTSLNFYPNSNTLANLTTINCSFNQITSLTISNTTLTNLNISNNNLSTIVQSNTNYTNLTNLNISNNQFTTYTVDFPNLTTFDCVGNPLTTLTYNRFSNNPINISNIVTLQNLIFNYQIIVPSINLSQLQSLNNLKVNFATIQNDLILNNLPALNCVDFKSNTSSLTLSNNLGFTEINNGYNSPNTIDIKAVNFKIINSTTISNIDIQSFDVVNFEISNISNLTSLKFPGGLNLQSISLNLLPMLQNLEIGRPNSSTSPNCIDLTIENFNNLNSIFIQNYNLGNLIINSLPSLVNFKNTATSCNSSSSNFTLTNLPLLFDAKILDSNLSNINVNNLNSLHDLYISSRKLTSLNLFSLPQLYNLKYDSTPGDITSSLPILTIQSLPNLYSIYLSRLNIGGINLNNLPNLYSFILTNDYLSTSYTPQVINYSINNLPNLYYVQLDEIQTTNLSFSNVPNINTLKMRESIIGTSYTFQNLSLEKVFIDDMYDLSNMSFNNLANFKNLNITNCSNIQSLNLGNTNTTLETFLFTSNYVQYTSITSLNFTNFPQLNSLTINYKLTALTLNNLPNLTFLNCSSNRLNTILLTNFPLLSEVVCNYNQPTYLSSTYKFPLTLNLPQLTKLDVNYNNNKLANLDLSNCPLLNELYYLLYNYSSSENIPYINLRNGNSNFSIFESNPINKICIDDDTEKVLLQSLNSNISNAVFTTYCSFNPAGTFYTVQGNSLLDINNNGCGVGDISFPMINLNIESAGITNSLFANNSGNYSLPITAGQYTITPAFENSNYYTFSPASVSVDFPTNSSPYIQNFCVTPNGNHNDLEINFLPIVPARPGFDAVYKLVYKNKGNQTQAGTINLNFNDSVLDFISATQTLSNQTTNLLNWTFTNLLPFESRSINVTFNLNSPTETPSVVSGFVLNHTAEIIGLTDENSIDNISLLNQIVVNSYDPNDKTCLEGNTITPNLVGEYVHYLIRFENNGTANAQNIVVKDMIDTSKFDINTLIPISGSHNFETRITSSNKVEFIFQNINLPFNNANNDGYVSFKIKTKPNLVVGNTFSNLANIYFDYNFPIVTNNYTTTIQNTLSLQEYNYINDIVAYPNPVKDFLRFKTEHSILKVEVYDIAGRILSSNSISENIIDLSALKTGNYILKLYTDKGIRNTKIMKE